MTTLVCPGFGYSAQQYAALHGHRFDRIVGTTRWAQNAARRAATASGGRAVEMLIFDGAASPQLAAAIADASVLLVSIPPDRDSGNDPVLTHLSDAIAAAARLQSIVYLSTTAVYGNHDGAWIDETTPPNPLLPHVASRIGAEQAWLALGEARGVPVAVVRVAGIYGPGANALESMKAGRAQRIVKPGLVFNRIHVADLAQVIDKAVDFALTRGTGGIFNAADDEPAAPGDPVSFAASLLGVAPPAEISFDEASRTMTPVAAGFYSESKRVRNGRIKALLGVRLRYPTYREGLRALAADSAASLASPGPRKAEPAQCQGPALQPTSGEGPAGDIGIVPSQSLPSQSLPGESLPGESSIGRLPGHQRAGRRLPDQAASLIEDGQN